jgi:hypothetical protein
MLTQSGREISHLKKFNLGDSFAIYIEQLELLTFFSGYPLLYSIVQFIYRGPAGNTTSFSESLKKSLTPAYALSATLFLGLVLKEYYSDSTNKMFAHSSFMVILRIWGILAVLFWIPALGKRPVYALLHSLPFFFLFGRDLLTGITAGSGNDFIRNDMKIYTISFLINLITLLLLILVNYTRIKIMRNKMNKTGV